ncbi:MAG: NrdJa, partial [Gammaproteobacteria bacterium SG8_31]
MKRALREMVSATSVADIPFQSASVDIWEKKYRLVAKDGTVIDRTMDDTYQRVARALADVEEEEKRDEWFERFVWALRNGAIPAGRIMSNAGALAYKPATSTINCTVSGIIGDSMDAILGKVHEAGLTLKAGCGIGYEFSTLRPRGAYVSGAGAYTSGPLSFMDIYDKMCFTVSSAGGRRGAQMGTFDVGHPDAMEFIRAKPKEVELENIDLEDEGQVVWREWPARNDYVVDDRGRVACKIYKTVPARRMWDVIMSSTYDFAEPGFVLIDRVNEMNNNWFCENIRATNPCGEQPLPPYGSCLLGSVNLTRFVVDPFTDEARFDWDLFRDVVKVFTRMLDNVVEINGLPLEQQQDEIFRKRRHGMGFLGLGSTLTLMGMKYGSKKSAEFTEKVARELALAGWETALDLAREKGPAPIMVEEFTVTEEMLRKRPEMRRDGLRAGDKVPGRVLHAKYSRYMQRVAEEAPELVAQ